MYNDNIHDTIITDYIHTVITARNSINTMLNVMSNQDRTLRTIITHTIQNNNNNNNNNNNDNNDHYYAQGQG